MNHIDTSDYYGPHLTNQIIRQALHPYPTGLVIVTKLGGRRPPDQSWQKAISPEELTAGVHDNLRNWALDALDIVNYRVMGASHGPEEGSIAEQVTVLADLRRKGLIRHIGRATSQRPRWPRRNRSPQSYAYRTYYNLAYRHDDALVADLARQGIAYVPFFPRGRFCRGKWFTLLSFASRPAPHRSISPGGCCTDCLNQLSIPGMLLVAHLRENLAAGQLTLSKQILAELDGIGAEAS